VSHFIFPVPINWGPLRSVEGLLTLDGRVVPERGPLSQVRIASKSGRRWLLLGSLKPDERKLVTETHVFAF
jgi:hypothetical protein